MFSSWRRNPTGDLFLSFLKKNERAMVYTKLELKFNLKNGDGVFYDYKPSKMNMAHGKKPLDGSNLSKTVGLQYLTHSEWDIWLVIWRC